MDLTKKLVDIGLTEHQSLVYLAALQLGVAPVLRIAKYAQLKRPSVYLLLDDLERLGLVSQVQRGAKTLWQAENPKYIMSRLQDRLSLAQELVPSLQALHNVDPSKPNIKIAEGVDGVRNVYNSIFDYLSVHSKEELLIFGSLKDAAVHFEAEVVNYFYWKMSQSHNAVREIGNDDTETRRYYRASQKLNDRHGIRLIRNDGRFIETDNMIYGNTLVIFSVKEEIFATSIQSKSVVETYRTLFNMAWRSGKRI